MCPVAENEEVGMQRAPARDALSKELGRSIINKFNSSRRMLFKFRWQISKASEELLDQ
jgi:hypothetical protein